MVFWYVRMGLFWDIVDLFVEMWGCGIQPNAYAISSLLTAFSRLDNVFFCKTSYAMWDRVLTVQELIRLEDESSGNEDVEIDVSTC